MSVSKIDWIIGVAVFVLLVFFFSFQAFPTMIENPTHNDDTTGSGTNAAEDDSDVIVPSDGDIPSEPENAETELEVPEYMESPKTSDDSALRDYYCIIYILAVVLCYCIVGAIMLVRRRC